MVTNEVGVRVDTGISSGNSISTFYDPMIAKLITYGDTREEALDKLERALRSFQVSFYIQAIAVEYLSHLFHCIIHTLLCQEYINVSMNS